MTVKAGDTLFGLARKHGVSLKALREANGLDKSGDAGGKGGGAEGTAHVLFVGDELVLPPGAVDVPGKSDGVSAAMPAAPAPAAPSSADATALSEPGPMTTKAEAGALLAPDALALTGDDATDEAIALDIDVSRAGTAVKAALRDTLQRARGHVREHWHHLDGEGDEGGVPASQFTSFLGGATNAQHSARTDLARGKVVDLDGRAIRALTGDGVPMRRDTDVLVAVVADWCKHCKGLEPAWQRLADGLAADESVKVARFDGGKDTDLALTALGVYRFPTVMALPKDGGLYMYAADSASEREPEMLVEFANAACRTVQGRVPMRSTLNEATASSGYGGGAPKQSSIAAPAALGPPVGMLAPPRAPVASSIPSIEAAPASLSTPLSAVRAAGSAEGPAPGAALVVVLVAAYGAYVARGMFVSLRWRAMFKGMSNVSVDLPPNVSRAKHITMTEYIREYGLFRQYTEFTNARLNVENREKAAASEDAARQPVKLKSWR